MQTIEIENVGPIVEQVIDLPEDSGGVLVFKGRNGAGKSMAIEVVRSLLAGKGKLPVRDGAKKGSAEGFGKRASVGQATPKRGRESVMASVTAMRPPIIR